MEKDVQEFIDLLFTPLPTEEAHEFLKLCREELAATLNDPCGREQESPSDVAEPEFDNAFAVAVNLTRAQRRRLITSLVNYEILLRRCATESDELAATRR